MRGKLFLPLVVVLVQPVAYAAITNLVADVPTRAGVTVRLLYNAPDSPTAHLIMFAGNDGYVGIQPDGSLFNRPPDFQQRIDGWIAGGVSFTVVDVPSDRASLDASFRRSPEHTADILAVTRYLQLRAAVPVWLMGKGSGAISVASVASHLGRDVPLGVIIGEPHTVGDLALTPGDLASIYDPTLVINHTQDPCACCPPSDVPTLVTALVNAAAVGYVALVGGDGEVGNCNDDIHGPHGWGGLQEFVTDTIVAWIKEHNNLLVVSGPPATETAVEYYYAEWNFYFVTSDPGEIAALDGGAFGGLWKRAGQTFNVWSDSTKGALATYRFFSTGFSPKSSHFYTPYINEYNSLRAGTAWEYEGIAFYVLLPDANGNCPAGTVVLYRLYNNGMGGAPNHRFTISAVTFNAMKASGWQFEGNGLTGAYACVPQ